MKEQKELLPCPFCGAVETLIVIPSDITRDSDSWVKCNSCGSAGQHAFRRNNISAERMAIAHWNTRASNQAAEAIIGELKADRDKQIGCYTYDKAKGFATAAHINQRRKYTNEPYINHCIEVAEKVLEHTKDYQVAAAALMHDVLEDTTITETQMREVFGDYITELVLCVTDVSKPEDGNRAIRKAMDLEHLKKCSSKAANIKYADLISNTSSIAKYDPGFAKKYLPEKRKALDVLKGKGNPILYLEARIALEQAEALI